MTRAPRPLGLFAGFQSMGETRREWENHQFTSWQQQPRLTASKPQPRKESIRGGCMSMFQDPRDEDRLCQVLKAYVEEWGPENVIVSVPEHWSEYSTSTLGRVR